MPQGIEITVPSGALWDALRLAIVERFAGEYFWIRVSEKGEKILLEGDVVSEDAKATLFQFVGEFLNGRHVVDTLLATSPLYPASQSHFDFDTGEDDRPTSGNIIRHPRILCGQELQAGKLCVIEVDLAVEPHDATEGNPLELEISDPNWETLPVTVELTSYQLEIELEDARRNIILFRNGTSKSARFAAKVVGELVDDLVHVTASFSVEGRVRGFATRDFAVTVAPGKTPPKTGRISSTSGDFSYDSAAAPALTIKISHNSNSLGQCTWSFEAPGFRYLEDVSAMPRIELGSSAKSYFQDKFEQVKTLDEGRHLGILRGIGEHIWEASPIEFRRLYLKMQKQLGRHFPIQIFTNEPHVPWELMHPTEADGEDLGHLCMTHPIGRWTMASRLVASIPRGGIASFVPDYEDGPLPAAVREGAWLCQDLGAVALEPTYRIFMDCLNTPGEDPIALLHFAGHGAGDEASPQERGLRMKDGWVPIEEINSGVKLGKRDQSLVLLNACHAGNQNNVLGALHGWPSAFLKVGFGGVVAPLWAVQDETACAVMKKAVTSLYCEGKSLGSALTAARKEYQSQSAAAYSYVLYGDVMATVISQPTTKQASAVPQEH